MASTQLRHLKLAWAGYLGSWELADYEVDEIRKSFDVAAKYYPKYQNVPFAKLIADVSDPALKEIDDAIKAKNHGGLRKLSKNSRTRATVVLSENSIRAGLAD
jgi:hypothetical protein